MKKLIIFALVAIATAATSVSAQSKIGHINSQELLDAMPQMEVAKDSLEKYQLVIKERYELMNGELQTKFEKYQNDLQGGVDKTILGFQEKEITSLQANIKDFEETANQQMLQKQEDLMTPLIDAVKDAINVVAKEGKFDIVLDSAEGGSVLYSNESTNIMPLVRKKLGL